MEDDWDLHAVVRGCATTTTTSSSSAAAVTSTTSQVFSNFQQDFNFSNSCFQDLFEPRRERLINEELHDVYKPLFPKNQESSQRLFSLQISPLSVLGDLPSEQHQQQITQLRRKPPSFSVSDVSKPHNPTPRSKRRKNHLKRVCHVAAENLSSDMWSWRKYGQKPIKGSPYPRGYYRCSTSKGCMARKQVERNRSDPGMFIVTYTSEHNHPMPTHRNSLAGSTRQKPAETPSPDDPAKPSSPEKLESSREDLADAEDNDDEFISKMALDDDFFVGLEDFTAPDSGDFSGHIPVNLPFPWMSSSATTAAGGD